MKTIVLTGGGTAGHCMPHLAILPYLKQNFDNIYYIGSVDGIEKDIISKVNIPYFCVPCIKLKREFSLDNLKIPFVLLKSIRESKKLLKDLKPDVVFSKGGFVSVPTVLAADKLNIPVVCHESDMTIGLANKISVKHCKKILTSFKETANSIKNGVFVGPPLFDNSNDDKIKYFTNDRPTILVLGGSLGSKAINQRIRENLDVLLPIFNVIHICGKNNVDNSIDETGYLQLEFSNDIHTLYKNADICISRAGSNTLFEILSKRIPSIFIPLPKNASRGDQIINAEYFSKQNVCKLIYQENLTSETLIKEVMSLHSNRKAYLESLNRLNVTNGSKTIAKIIYDVACDNT